MASHTIDGIIGAFGNHAFLYTDKAPDGIFAFPTGLDGVLLPLHFIPDAHAAMKLTLENGTKYFGTFDIGVDEGGRVSLAKVGEVKSIGDDLTKQNYVVRNAIAAMDSFGKALATIEEARLVSGITLTLSDWQNPDRADKTAPDDIQITLTARASLISLETPDGRTVSVELQDDNLRGLHYEGKEGRETPIVTAIPRKGDIIVDREDYDADIFFEDERAARAIAL